MATEKKVTEKVEIKLDDGRTVTFTGKSRMNKEILRDAQGEIELPLTIRLDYRNGETRSYLVPEALHLNFLAHGALQKYGDKAAGIEKLEDVIEAIDQLHVQLEKGQWEKEGEGGSGMAGASVLAKALVRITGQDIKVVREYLAGLDAKVKMQLRISEEVAPVIKQIEAELEEKARAAGKLGPALDVKATLAGLMPKAAEAEAEPAAA